MNNYTITNNNENVGAIDIWAIIYLCIVYIFSFTVGKGNAITFCILLVLAIPFVYKIENFIAITYIVSPIAYFYTQSDEGLLSIYTICLIFLLLKFIRKGKIYKSPNIRPSIFLMIIALISFLTSPYVCEKGFFELLYIIIVSVAYSTLIDINWHHFFAVLTRLARLTLAMFTCVFILSPVWENFGRYTIDASVNVNTTGFAISQITIILAVNALISQHQTKTIDWILSCVGVILLLFSGSRNAILATIVAIGFVVLIYGKRKHLIGKAALIIASLALLFLLILNLMLSSGMLGDANRLSIASIVASGGTNRIEIWTTVIPFVIHNFFWFGYGPSTGVSTIVLEKLVNRIYSHTHNTFVEVFAETGILGFFVFLILTIKSIKRMIEATKKDSTAFFLLALLLGTLFASIGESYFNTIVWWIIIGLSFAYRTQAMSEEI